MRMLVAFTCLSLGLVILAGSQYSSAAQGSGPKYTIPDVMKKAHSGGNSLLSKVKSGKATQEEVKTLVEMYEALAKNKPPQGDDKSWKERTDALLEGAKLYADGKKDDALPKLTKASNCASCHKAHKG